MPTVNGTPVNFTFGSVAIAITNITGALYQGIDYKLESKRTLVTNQNGDRVTSAHADQVKTVKIEWVVTGTGMANALANTTLNAPGSYIIITACAALPDLVHATNKWEVISASLPAKNDSVMTITLECEYAANIQTFPATS